MRGQVTFSFGISYGCPHGDCSLMAFPQNLQNHVLKIETLCCPTILKVHNSQED
jgi:hypothetical protein